MVAHLLDINNQRFAIAVILSSRLFSLSLSTHVSTHPTIHKAVFCEIRCVHLGFVNVVHQVSSRSPGDLSY